MKTADLLRNRRLRSFTVAQIKNIVEQARKGVSYMKLADKYGCSYQAIRYHCMEAGIDRKKIKAYIKLKGK